MAELGLFRPDERLELLEGEVIEKVSPQGEPHVFGVMFSADTLRRTFGAQFHVREEKSMVLSDLSEPEPDVVVVRGTSRMARHHPMPADAVLVMEVSDTTLAFDQGDKAAAYARAGVVEYWILDLRRRRLEVRRDPGLVGENEYGYRTLHLVTSEGAIAPLELPDVPVRVADLLPAPLPEEPNNSVG
jgi:Uma2 family endonuclease